MTPWLTIIGLGEDGLAGLSSGARALLESAELLVGGARHLALRRAAARRAPDLGDAALASRSPRSRAGAAGRWWCWRPAIRCGSASASRSRGASRRRRSLILPQLGALARGRAARLAARRSRDDHAPRPRARHAGALPRTRARILILSEDGATPAQVAAFLTARGWGRFDHDRARPYGLAAETRHTRDRGAVGRAPGRRSQHHRARVPRRTRAIVLPRSGLPDDAFETTASSPSARCAPRPWRRSRRCPAAPVGRRRRQRRDRHRMAARRARHRRHRDRARYRARPAHRANAATLGVPQLRVLMGTAPDALAGLEVPDAVFVGGGLRGRCSTAAGRRWRAAAASSPTRSRSRARRRCSAPRAASAASSRASR